MSSLTGSLTFMKALLAKVGQLRERLGDLWPGFQEELKPLLQELVKTEDDSRANELVKQISELGQGTPAAKLLADLFQQAEKDAAAAEKAKPRQKDIYQYHLRIPMAETGVLTDGSEKRSLEGKEVQIKKELPEITRDDLAAAARELGDAVFPAKAGPPQKAKPPSEGETGAEKPRPEFQFKLTGPQVCGNSVAADTEASLEFFLGEVDKATIAIMKGQKLDQAMTTGGELSVFLVPKRYQLTEGGCLRTATVKDWVMTGEMVFKLKAGPVPNADAGAWVYLDLDKKPIYAFFLAMPIVEDVSRAQAFTGTPPAIDLETRGVPIQARLVMVNQQKDELQVELKVSYLNQETQSSPPDKVLDKLTLAKLEEALEGVPKDNAQEVAQSGIWGQLPDPFNYSAEDFAKQLTADNIQYLADHLKEIAQAGWDLWVKLTADQDLKKILSDVDKLPPGSRIEVVTDSVFVPWEILYPENVEEMSGGVKPGLFWGARYIIQSTLPDVDLKEIDKEKQEHYCPHSSDLCVCVDPAIDRDFAEVLPAASPQNWATNFMVEPAEGRRLLLSEKNVAKWLYFLCHGKKEEIALGGKNIAITPANLQETIPFSGRPIVFFNSCLSGAFAPLSLTNFYKEFRESKKVLGLVATSFSVPTMTAAVIGRQITESYLKGEKDLGTIILELRQDLLAKGIPIGLYYTLHCPADIRPHPPGA